MDIDSNVLQLWFHYEEVAMHFNQMIIQYRLQVMAGTGIVGTVGSYIVGSKSKEPETLYALRAFFSCGLLVLFISAAAIDLLYYNELLLGAVDALIELESRHPEINLSTAINNRFASEINPDGETTAIHYVYYGLGAAISAFTVYSVGSFLKQRNTSICLNG